MMTLGEAAALFATPARLKALKKLIGDKKARRATLAGLKGSAAAVLLGKVADAKHPMVIVADDADSAGYLYHDLSRVAGCEVAFFPAGYKRHIKYGGVDAPQQILRAEAIDAWRNGKIGWIVTYPDALAERVPMMEDLEKSTLKLTTAKKANIAKVEEKLEQLGFRQVDYVYEPGQFARRGSILDVFSYSNELPYRLDFFDDEIDSIRTFNVETQLSEQRLGEVSIVAASAAEGSSEHGVSLLEFIGNETPLFVADKSALVATVRDIASQQYSESAAIAEEGDAESMKKVVDAEDFASRIEDFRIFEFGMTATTSGADAVMEFNTSPQALYHKNFDIISESFTQMIADGYRLLILSDSAYQGERLKEIFADRGDKIDFTPVAQTLHAGFVDHDTKTCFFTDHQIFDRFHKYSLKSDKARSGKRALSLKELNQIEIGDYIVHIDHGIGRFAGLIKTDTNGSPQEMIKLLYQNDDMILVSIHSLHKLSKYRGKEGVPPKINKLGSGAWNRIKERTKTKMKDIARDLIKLYAARREEKGFAYSPDSYLQHELEASFIYEDTPDQLKATQAIKADMESTRPMDRLVCGDVGFGKTELAIRAAFKAATDSKQTAVLVPTTVLAMQHYRTFKQRLKDLPVRVEFISRAKKPKEVKQILADLEAGKVDILIGTHKLIGKSVMFTDLRLLTVD